MTATRPDIQPNPEYPLIRVLTTETGIVLGIMIILLVQHNRRRALRIRFDRADKEIGH
ncbi:hypothetical protein [Paenibacillus jiagnxiensis]|uniref:hypothetical protein n=1 Tax=Paenibacillus jiagnxiensis TaxID=3228926 RepID=UPI0033BC8FB9